MPRLHRSERLLVLELPWFRGMPFGELLYLALAIPVGLAWGRRQAPFLAIQLTAPAVAAGVCARLRPGRFIGFALTSGKGAEIETMTRSRWWPLRRRLLAAAEVLVGQTGFASREIAEAIPGVATAVVPTGIESVEPPPLSGKPSVLFAGRLNESKGVVGLLDAWAAIAGSHPDARLTIAGDGAANGLGWQGVEDDLRRTVASSPPLRRSVEMPGWVADLRPRLASNDIVVLPSLSEGMSRTLLEACAWRRVVVASDIPANRAVLGDDYPLLFAAGDRDALAAALETALDDHATRRACVERISERTHEFDLDSVLDRIEALIR
jgi:glycosyltransferase involved in cell wall biosynthesis